MKLFKRSLSLKLLFLCALLSFAAQAHALIINPSTTPNWFGSATSTSQILSDIAPHIGTSVELYKDDVGAGESGTLASSYQTILALEPPTNTPAGDMATISYAGGDIVGPTAFLLVKDGNHDPAWYLFNLTDNSWDGMETLNLEQFWPNGGNISHVSLFGTQVQVPEPATIFLLAASLLGLAGIGRKKIKK